MEIILLWLHCVINIKNLPVIFDWTNPAQLLQIQKPEKSTFISQLYRNNVLIDM